MKYCPNCGNQLVDEARFCSKCGTAVAPVTNPASDQPQPTDQPAPDAQQNANLDEETLKRGIQLCADGKYRWIYELNMWTNPSVLFVVYKIFGWIFLGIFLFMAILSAIDGNWDNLWSLAKGMLIFAAVFAVLIYLGYALLALIYGGKYIVLFEMDDKEVVHRQMKSQVKKAEAIGWITAMVGILAKRPTTVGAGILAATHTTSVSTFDSVRSVKPYKKRNLIKVNELLFKNQVYVSTEEFDFVYDYIVSHCPRLKK